MNLVTIATNFNLGDAGLICSRLDAAGFHPVIANEMAAGWLGGNSTATLLRIQVPESEAVDAKVFLDTPVEFPEDEFDAEKEFLDTPSE